MSINIYNTKEEINGDPNVYKSKGASSQHINLCHTSAPNNMNEWIQYKVLISCIEFGDKLGDWVVVPIVLAIIIQRDNDHMNLELMIIPESVRAIISLIFFKLISNE